MRNSRYERASVTTGKKAGVALAAALVSASLSLEAHATLRVYTMDESTWLANQASDTFVVNRYWEWGGSNRWGTVWEMPYAGPPIAGLENVANHFHLGFGGQAECLDINTNTMGTGDFWDCDPLPTHINRGPILTHGWAYQLYFQVVQDSGATVPFKLDSIDVYNSASESIYLYVRTTSGAWYWWGPLSGAGPDNSTGFARWTTFVHPGDAILVAWKTAVGGAAGVGRIVIDD